MYEEQDLGLRFNHYILGQHIYIREISKSEVIKQVMGEIKHMVKRLSERDVVIVRKSME